MLERFTAPLEAAGPPTGDTGRRLTAQLVPFGRVIDHDGLSIQFDRGALTVPDGEVVPLTVDHADGSTYRIGKLVRYFETETGAYADFDISETTLGSDILTLLHDGVLTDGSIGVLVDADASTVDAAGVTHRAGRLDHFSIVPRGSFDVDARVLSVHAKENTMKEDTPDTAPADEAYDDSEVVSELARVSAEIDELRDTRVSAEPNEFTDTKDFILAVHRAGRGDADASARMEKHARYIEAHREDYALDTADTTDAAGLVPDYLSSTIIGLIDDFRPSVNAFGRIDPGPYGMSVVLPKVTVKPTVDVQASELAEAESTAMDVATASFDLDTYAGAGRVSVQLIERSQPSYVDRLLAELAGVYAEDTNTDFIAALIAGVGTNTAVLADFSADAGATYAAVLAGVGVVAADIKRPADRLIMSTNKWVELMSLVDSEDRPLILPPDVATNPQGTASGDGWRFRYFPGLTGIHDPHAAADSVLVAWSGAAAAIETPKQQIRVVQAGVLGLDIGIWGLFDTAILYGGNTGGLYSITAS